MGLHLNVTKTFRKSWVFRYTPSNAEVRFQGSTAGRKKPRAMGLGPFPAVSVSMARERAEGARRLLAEGLDPLEEKKAERTKAENASRRVTTFAEAVEAYLLAKVEAKEGGFKNEKHRQQWRNTLTTYALPFVGSVDVADVGTDHILQVLQQKTDKNEATGSLWNLKTETASRVRGRIETILSWAAFRGLRPQGDNPARWKGHLDNELIAPSKLKKVKHHASMPYVEVEDFMVKLRARAGVSNRALEFAILTVARSSEVRKAVWSEFDLEANVWTIPEDRMKKEKEHDVPLTARMVAILKSVPQKNDNPHVFIGESREGRLSENALLNTLEYMGYDDLTQHGFRSSFREWAGEMTSHPREVIEHALAHGLKDKSEAAYQRGTLFPKRRELMADWSEYCGNYEMEKSS
jgi:integrase